MVGSLWTQQCHQMVAFFARLQSIAMALFISKMIMTKKMKIIKKKIFISPVVDLCVYYL